jgi:hypothetical protein
MTYLKLTAALVASGALITASASAGTQTKFPSEHAACVAQAWVPANTDPAEPSLGSFIRTQAQTGQWGQEIRQQGCKL